MWVEQTRPGGLIVVPWGTRWTNTAAVARLRVADDMAMGWFTRPVEFMLDRGQRGCKEFTVYQGGPRNLWSEVESVYRWWHDQGEPDVTRFGLTVTPSGQQVFLDTPDNVIN